MKEKLLMLFKENEDSYLSGEKISQTLGVTRAFIWKLVRALEQDGYSFEAKPRKGYRLTSSPDVLSRAELAPLLHTKNLGEQIVYYPETKSTNTEARRLAEDGAESGTVVTASFQTSGKARNRSTWIAETDACAMMSVILRPSFAPERLSEFLREIPEIVCRTLESVISHTCTVDDNGGVYINDRKVCGTLMEFSGESGYIDYIIIGIGVNTSTHAAPSLLEITGKNYSKLHIAAAVINSLDQYIENFK